MMEKAPREASRTFDSIGKELLWLRRPAQQLEAETLFKQSRSEKIREEESLRVEESGGESEKELRS